MWGKLVDGNLKLAPNPIVIEDATISNPMPEHLSQAGYKPVRYTQPPVQEGYYPVCTWREDETEIVQEWTLVPEPEPEAEEKDLLAALEELGVQDEEENT